MTTTPSGSNHDLEQLHTKVRRLEGQLRLAGIAGLVAVVLILAGAVQQQDEISTRQLLLRNADGDVVAWLGTAHGTPALGFFGNEGRKSLERDPGVFLAQAKLVLLGGDVPALEMRQEAFASTREFVSLSPSFLLMEGERGTIEVNLLESTPSETPLISQRRNR